MTQRDLPITLVMVSYNKQDTIALAIESAASGSMKPDLLVISDDGSDDGTPGVAEHAAKRFGIPCRIVRHQRVGRYRIQTMRNTCAANALDGIVFLSDSDCLFGEHAIETHYELHRKHPRAIGTGPRYEFLDGSNGPFLSTYTTLEFAHVDRGHYCVPVGANYSFRKSLWKQLGGFDRAFEGSYGMEEFQFSQRAVEEGAECVSDPLGYVFHIPHETVFGNRSAARNIGVFDATYSRTHIDEEREFLEQHVVPTYWAGARKVPLLGSDREKLDAWGAPAGFVPPPHLELLFSLRPFVEPVERALGDKPRKRLEELKTLTQTFDWRRLPKTAIARQQLESLHSTLRSSHDPGMVVQRLQTWLDAAKQIESTMSNRAAGTAAQS